LENKIINISVVAEVASALQELKEEMVFVGGAIISLYTDDDAADEIRPTFDVDLTLHVVNLGHWEKVQEKLRKLDFHPDPFGHAICSYKYKNILVDIMANEDGPLGPANRWYKIGFENLQIVKAKEQEIKILSAPCYLATKFEAFNGRGTDLRTSHDIEDIIYVLDNRINIVEEIKKDDERVQAFLKEQFNRIIKKGLLREILLAHIHPLMLAERMPIVEEKINQITTN